MISLFTSFKLTIRIFRIIRDNTALKLGAVGGEGGEEGDEAAHGVTDDEQGQAGPDVHHLLAELDHGPGELVHVPGHHPLPLTLPVTNMIEAKHQEVSASPGLGQLRVVGHQVLCIAVGVIRKLDVKNY